MSADLVGWLRGCLDEDEQVARQVFLNDHADYSANWTLPSSSVIDIGEDGPLQAYDRVLAHHIVRWDPARVLAEVAAKRAILDRWTDDARFPDFDGGYESAMDNVVFALAQPYRGRPGWRDEWGTG